MAWLFVAFMVLANIGLTIYLFRHDPVLLAVRLKGFKGTKSWDKVLAPTVAIVMPMVLLIVAGLDKRFGWSPELPLAVHIAAFGVIALGYAVVVSAMAVNTFFAASVRTQTERNQKVIDTGPYGIVRHPGYVGACLADLALALALGSFWALIPAVMAVILFVVRTALEDNTLMEELDGYRDYAQRVPFRLVPGIW